MTETMPLTEREKETLRLLLIGHDAKSIARRLDLSVHTVNERLRDARRKLGVSSSREAARRLAEMEAGDAKFLADKDFGVAENTMGLKGDARSAGGRGAGQRLVWLGGGMIVMSVIVVAIALLAWPHSRGEGNLPAQAELFPIAAPAAGTMSPVASSARDWLALIDAARWTESWDAAGTMIKTQLSAAQWRSTMASARTPLGAVSYRKFLSENRTRTLPGLPDGDYDVIQFQTDFAKKSAAIETVFLAREGTGWKVNGYFIR
ncbi:MAG: DUF4019 domain-containing protein [Devosia sp.]|uniref:helix-turn-helix domain-containing protein n=1 Tax=Devosia sp. TaxID=1871048 RepID=UPI0033983B96